MALPKDEYLSHDSRLYNPARGHFLELESILLPPNKKKSLEGGLKAKKLIQRMAAYFELDIFKMFKSANLRPQFLDPKPDLQITLTDKTICYVECTVCCWYEDEDYKNFNRVQSILSKQFDSEWKKAQKDYSQVEKFGGLEIVIHSYNGNKINPDVAREYLIKESLQPATTCSAWKKYDDKNLHFSYRHDPDNPNLLGFEFPFCSSSKIKAIKNKLKEKRPDSSIEVPYFIALCLWGWQGSIIQGNEKIDLLIPGILEKIKEYFLDNLRVSGILLFCSKFFPIQGVNYCKGIEDYVPTQFHEKKGDWSFPMDWSKEQRSCIFIKNLSSNTEIHTSFEENLSQVIKFYNIKM